MATAKKAKKSAPAKKKAAKSVAKKPSTPALDWAATIKKAAAEKRTQANWPGGAGDGWKKKTRV
jgi:hypothetical protein